MENQPPQQFKVVQMEAADKNRPVTPAAFFNEDGTPRSQGPPGAPGESASNSLVTEVTAIYDKDVAHLFDPTSDTQPYPSGYTLCLVNQTNPEWNGVWAGNSDGETLALMTKTDIETLMVRANHILVESFIEEGPSTVLAPSEPCFFANDGASWVRVDSPEIEYVELIVVSNVVGSGLLFETINSPTLIPVGYRLAIVNQDNPDVEGIYEGRSTGPEDPQPMESLSPLPKTFIHSFGEMNDVSQMLDGRFNVGGLYMRVKESLGSGFYGVPTWVNIGLLFISSAESMYVRKDQYRAYSTYDTDLTGVGFPQIMFSEGSAFDDHGLPSQYNYVVSDGDVIDVGTTPSASRGMTCVRIQIDGGGSATIATWPGSVNNAQIIPFEDEILFLLVPVGELNWEIAEISKWGASNKLKVNEVAGTSHTLSLIDAGQLLYTTNGSGVTITIPPNSYVGFDVGTTISISQDGVGQVEVVGDTGVTLWDPNGAKTKSQYSMITIVKRAEDIWQIAGDTEE